MKRILIVFFLFLVPYAAFATPYVNSDQDAAAPIIPDFAIQTPENQIRNIQEGTNSASSGESDAIIERPLIRRVAAPKKEIQAPPVSITKPKPELTPDALEKIRADLERIKKNSKKKAKPKKDDSKKKGSIPLKASVRLRVRNQTGENFSSGTIVDVKNGHALIVSCGHIFRGTQKSDSIEADVFERDENGNVVGTKTVQGKLLDYNLEGDVSFMSIPVPSGIDISVAPIAPAETALKEGDVVQSVGCGGGANPTLQTIRVTRLNRYLGPDNVECTGVPVQGRSGGGLFNEEGYVVGVCNAADPRDQRGMYAGLNPIRELFKKINRTFQGR